MNQEENMIRQCKRKGGNIITRRLRNWSSCRKIEGNKSDVWIRGTMQKHVENLCKKNQSSGWMDGVNRRNRHRTKMTIRIKKK
jgi:hypothetical protein